MLGLVWFDCLCVCLCACAFVPFLAGCLSVRLFLFFFVCFVCLFVCLFVCFLLFLFVIRLPVGVLPVFVRLPVCSFSCLIGLFLWLLASFPVCVFLLSGFPLPSYRLLLLVALGILFQRFCFAAFVNCDLSFLFAQVFYRTCGFDSCFLYRCKLHTRGQCVPAFVLTPPL